MSDIRVGHGYDVHRFADAPSAGAQVWLCGVPVPHSHVVLAHSDGDIPVHALCDALLGAVALGDIGHHFPDTDPRFKGADSRVLLRHVVALLAARGYRVGNADITLVAQSPKVAPHVDAMRANLAADLGVAIDRVNIKATTTEKLGFAGRGEGIAAYAVALVVGHG
jgi:2-C-methyl-D-erythritol 2,4-cyclodiphosphate synthase